MIKIPRPHDPELAAAWDEAKRTLMARGATPAERRKMFAAIDADCCVGNRSQCRCQAKQVARVDETWTDEENER